MKHSKKYGFWVFFSFIVLIGSLVIINFSFQKQSPGIPNVNAQSQEQANFPGDTFFIPHGSPHSYDAAFASHPSDTFYIPRRSNLPVNSNYDYYMPGVRTISTASTCAWDCGQTYTTCYLTCGRGAQGRTSQTCGSGLFGNCLDQTPTSTTCSSGIFCNGTTMPTSSTCSGSIFCDGGPSPTFTTCSSGIFCGGPTPTSTTCGIFCDGGPMPTFSTCSSGIFCGGPIFTSATCSGGSLCGFDINTTKTCIVNCTTIVPAFSATPSF